jgi:hypothetical protein
LKIGLCSPAVEFLASLPIPRKKKVEGTWGLGFRVWGLGFAIPRKKKVEGTWVWDLGSRVSVSEKEEYQRDLGLGSRV